MPVRFGVIGLGDGGRCNIRGLQMAGARAVALCDLNVEESAGAFALAANHEIALYDDYARLVENPAVDLVVVSTPDILHVWPAESSLRAGKYVFVEKPLATTMRGVEIFNFITNRHPSRLIFSEKWCFGYPIQALLANRRRMGRLLVGHASFTQFQSELIMGRGKWRTEHAYNPCAGGGAHFTMVLRLLLGPIVSVCSIGHIRRYKELARFGGYDTMEGIFRFADDSAVTWSVCIAAEGRDARLGHRSGSFTLQFESGCFVYGVGDAEDRLFVGGERIAFTPEPEVGGWEEYNIAVLYRRMHEDTLRAVAGEPTRCNVRHGINASAACALAFESARDGGTRKELPGWSVG